MPSLKRLVNRVPGSESLVKWAAPVPIIRATYRRLFRFLENGDAPPPVVDYFQAATIPRAVAGRLVVSAHGGRGHVNEPAMKAGGASQSSVRHRHRWIANWNYSGMEDNDIRGFVDGRFKFAWNQPSQIHVRLGRFQRWSGNGEWELFRVLQRWEGFRLPSDAVVENACIQVEVEEGLAQDLEIFLYAVQKEWLSGLGGVRGNNNSVPMPGEVWWNEVGHQGRRWALPGAGFASDTHPDADTPVQPLVRAVYRPGDRSVTFHSKQLARYVEHRVHRREPLLFLLKLSDYLEDTPGALLHLFSANHGDSRNQARRPRCVVDWHASAPVGSLVEDVLLEHGRSLILPRIEARGARSLAVSFEVTEGCEPPTIHVRGGKGNRTSEWRPAHHPMEVDWDWLEVRLVAFSNPVPLGTLFEAELRDTWVRTGPPEEQQVLWSFISPTGSQHTITATYDGDFRWRVQFTPSELGRWRYSWTQRFIDKPYESAEGHFDVVPGDRSQIFDALHELRERAESSLHPPGEKRVRSLGIHFQRLQRAMMSGETPETFPLSSTESDGGSAGSRLDAVRRALGGRDQDLPRLEPHE